MRSAGRLVLVAWLGSGCATTSSSAARPRSAPPVVNAPVAPPVPAATPTLIDRADLVRVLDAGVARFLSGVEMEPVLDRGRFVGFRIVSFYASDQRLGEPPLSRGDVVLAVNDLPLERPEQAFRIWQVLRVANELRVRVLRDGQARELRYAIGD